MDMETDNWVLEAIRFHNTKGANVASIIEYIDYRDHFRYEAGEIEAALQRLSKDSKVTLRDGSYFLANEI